MFWPKNCFDQRNCFDQKNFLTKKMFWQKKLVWLKNNFFWLKNVLTWKIVLIEKSFKQKKCFDWKKKFFQMLSWTSSLHKTNFVGCIVYRYRSLQYKWNCTFSLSSMLSTIGKLSTLRNPSYWLVEAVNSLRWEEFVYIIKCNV